MSRISFYEHICLRICLIIVAMGFLYTGLGGSTSCTWPKPNPVVAEIVIDCGVPAITRLAKLFFPSVYALLSSDVPTWDTDMGELEVRAGKDALACAMAFAATKLQHEALAAERASGAMPAPGGGPGQLSPVDRDRSVRGQERAKKYSTDRGWRATGADWVP